MTFDRNLMYSLLHPIFYLLEDGCRPICRARSSEAKLPEGRVCAQDTSPSPWDFNLFLGCC